MKTSLKNKIRHALANPKKGVSPNSFVEVKQMKPAELQGMEITYQFSDSAFGEILSAQSGQGLVFLGFTYKRESALADMKRRFPGANFQEKEDKFWKKRVEAIVTGKYPDNEKITLHLYGTPFQQSVWEHLLTIPTGALSTYGEIAKSLDKPGASRAVGTAVGSNPVSYIVPCHRVVRASGELGGYHWGVERKEMMLEREL